jgi:HEAT repeat protein
MNGSSAIAPVQPAVAARPEQVETLLRMLQRTDRPDLREWAAGNLATVDWRTNPRIVPALVKTGCEDSVPFVRVACVRALGQMGANTMPVVSAMQTWKTDSDPRVRHEAEQALSRLTSSQPMQPVSLSAPTRLN